jgi:putative ABC transport system permease protein
MMRTLRQIAAVTAMNLRSLPDRPWTAIAAIVAIALVVGVLLGFLGLSNGFAQTVKGSGSESVAIVIRDGAGGELNSTIARDQAVLIAEGPGIARDAAGRPVVSGELFVIVDGKRRSTGIKANLPLRGVDPAQALAVRDGVAITEGRMFAPGAAELVVGAGVSKQFEGFEIGKTIRLRGQDWTIVGTFAAGGSVFESEIWGDVTTLQGLLNRGSTVQTIRVRMESPDAVKALGDYSQADPRLKLRVVQEREYYATQTSGVSNLIFFIGWPLAILMSFGALAGALNTMYASVDARTKEIATLRALGFRGLPAFAGTMAEALVLAAIGGLVGAGGTYLLFNGLSASTLGSGFTQVVFSLQLSPDVVWQGVILALVIGFIGGLFPAWRAARIPLAAAFRAN